MNCDFVKTITVGAEEELVIPESRIVDIVISGD